MIRSVSRLINWLRQLVWRLTNRVILWVQAAGAQGGAVIANADDEGAIQEEAAVNGGTEGDDEALSLQSIQEALKSALADGFEKVGISGIDIIKGILEYVQQFREHTDDMTLARQLHRLHSMYFSRPGQWKYSEHVETMYRRLARKVNHVALGKLWPEGSWLSEHFTPNPSWLTQKEADNVLGMDAPTYRHSLRQLGYAPLSAPTKDALDQIWLALYSSTAAAAALQTTDTERYAVVSYVQVAGRKEPPATWTSEVDSVLTALAEMEIITEKAVWFDKLASRQYKDSQKWWGAAATMQFLFNPVIVLLPRLSEQQAFVASVGNTLWGSDEADRFFGSFVQHAKQCTCCRASYTLRWALEQDFVLPIASLRTWPRVEHALGASGFGLFTSETTYVALAALLTCTFAMFGALFKNDQNLLKLLMPENFLPSTHVRDDASIMIGWVHVSCSNWQSLNAGQEDLPALKEIASCMNELRHLFCKLQTPKHLASQRTAWSDLGGPQYETKQCKPCGGLFYPITEPDWEDKVDVPTLAQYNSNDTFDLHSDYRYVSRSLFAIVQLYWALSNMSRNSRIYVQGEKRSISNGQFLTARREALTTLVHSKAAEAPCYAWDDKVVAAILLSSPKVFLDAVKHWGDAQMLADLTASLRNAGVLAETEEVHWEPNTLIAALAMDDRRHTVHRLLPRPEGAWRKRCAHVRHLIATNTILEGLGTTDVSTHKCFAGYFLGHLPLRTLDALHFRTPAGSSLPRLNDWVYRGLQRTSLCDSNIVVIRHAILGPPAAPPSHAYDPDQQVQQISYCWHCQKLLEAGLEPPGATRAPDELIWPAICPPDDPSLQGVIWGLGCYDPLNLGMLFDPNYYFGLQPDTVSVLLEHVGTRRNTLHAHALAHFSILGSAVHACSKCYGIILEEHDPHWGLWTILPIDCSNFNERFVVI
ncbi:hypothetical protein GOP47_0018214 [Adiantum capillus-veneris]|uniref:Uncharacterized protein n=1 Tax=Adiantum capillus-veneris TaxID=13818 RepID=A0A9D4UGW4_ADICA|nr:hypothetical protein GOP47_0018214 [Adiantum capillus-veneris]